MRLLVVEDEARLARALQKGLRAEGFAVDLAARRGRRAGHAPGTGSYDAMVLDVMLPGLSGYEVVRALRAERNWVPVLMLSAKDGEYDQADGLDCRRRRLPDQAVLYVVLLARLRALLRRGAPQRPAVLAAGDLLLDPAARDGVPRRHPDRADRPGVLAAGVPDAAGRARWSARFELLDHVWDAYGEHRGRMRSRSTSGTCGARSTHRSDARR